MTDQVAQTYADAPDAVREIALAIREGTEPNIELIQGLGADVLSQLYHSETRTLSYLLNDTLWYDNVPMAVAMIEGGAAVNYHNGQMMFNALRMREGPSLRPFADYGPGIPFLKLYLENGGDPNVPYTRDNTYSTPLARAHDNLAGVLLLLQHGADGWLEVFNSRGHHNRSYFDMMAVSSAGVTFGEIMFRIAHAGYFQGSTQEQIDVVFATLERYLKEIEGSRSSRELGQKWRIQAIVEAILETTNLSPSPELARLMADRAPDRYGSWWLRPDQLITGDEYIDGSEITHGTLVWTHLDPVPRERPTE
ncbi:hypothetical protein [Halocynthiibacter namhaensis]|uniref:hypothetical protein n=1 Tax=Halocynthiibacter namhaensis TaxID=1290553 RepID=UPI000B2C8121|nr:hypothetical protein [Halocynthiibacter namhaensis]